MSALRDIRLAFALLTGVPVGVEPWTGDSARSSRLAAWFPLVGFVLGAIPASALIGLSAYSQRMSDGLFAQRAAYVLAVAVIGFWAWATRMLHWDGLGDVADALWGGHTLERRLEIAADPRIGSFGATGIALVAAAQIASAAALIATGTGWMWVILAAPVTGRVAATFAAVLGKPARQTGLAASVAIPAELAATSGIVGGVVLGLAWVPAHVWAATDSALSGGAFPMIALMVATTAAAATIPHLLSRPFGGVTGDVMGASILLTETACLAGAALMAAW